MAFSMEDFHFHFHKTGGNNALFNVSDIDEAGPVYYYGFLGINGHWVIMQNDAGACTYCAGQKNYASYWTLRAALDYVRYDELEVTYG